MGFEELGFAELMTELVLPGCVEVNIPEFEGPEGVVGENSRVEDRVAGVVKVAEVVTVFKGLQ